jgi:gliding motility-associated-like protein
MAAPIRPSKTLLVLCIICIFHVCVIAQDSVLSAIIKANSIPPQHSFFNSNPTIEKIPVTQTASKDQKRSSLSFQTYQYPSLSRSQTNIACPDSSFLKIFEAQDRAYNFYTSAKTNDAGIVIGGYGRDKLVGPPYNWYSTITKFDSIGQHVWSKELKSDVIPGLGLYIEAISILSDGSIIVSGTHENPLSTSPPNVGDDFFMAKLTSTGNLVWIKTYHLSLGNDCSLSNVRYAWVAEGPNADLYVGATVPPCSFFPGFIVVFKLNSAGDVQWQYKFTGHFLTTYCMGIFYEGATLTAIVRGNGTDQYAGSIDFIKLNSSTGAYISHKSWQPDLPYPDNFYATYLYWTPTVIKLINGNYCVYGNTFGDFNNPFATNLPHFSITEFNSNYDFVKGYTINSPLQDNAYSSKIKVDRFGKVIYGMTELLNYPDGIKYYGIADNGVILHQRKKPITGLEIFYDNAELFDDGSVVYINNLSTVNQSNFYLYYSKMHITDTSSICLGTIDNYSTTSPITYKPSSFIWTAPTPNPMIATGNQNNSIVPLVYTAPPPCYQTTICDTIKIHGTANSCDMQQDFIFTAFKNISCGARVNWSIDTSVLQTFQVVNDTTLLIRFDQSWQGWLYAKIRTACGELTDSVLLTMRTSPGPVNIGPDTMICPSNTVILNAHKGYAAYLWNTGAIDSTISITTPGTYYVDVADSCGNFFSDTILVSASPPVPISIGPDRAKCNSDTLHLQAPNGFLNYTWSPNYNISATNTQQVIVNPTVDTSYTIMAEKTPGCFGYDTVRIIVNTSPLINLGPDKSFCTGDSLVLNAGTGFTQYQWSNGNNTQQITTYTAGAFSVIGTTANGCKSFDTLRVLNVYSLPAISLGKDSTLCAGDQQILDAGNGFASYNWNTGNNSPSIVVSSIGVYSVTVIDNNGCKGSGTTKITTIFPKPSGFLGPDTAICPYLDQVQLKTTTNFNEYVWSTGSLAASVTIKQAGVYWLQVKDVNDCIGKDTVIVNPKDCGQGFYMPTGFTPNNDGKNDLLKPILLGDVVQYRFWIYNRWGELIFETTDLNKGWDGVYKGQPQASGIFVWRCVYQFLNETVKEANGTVVLIR